METPNDSNLQDEQNEEEKEMERILEQNEYASSALLKILHHINKKDPDKEIQNDKGTDSHQ